MIENNKGFTLIEIMIAIAISSIVGLAIAMFYQSQVKTTKSQSLINRMQQNIRTAVYYLENEIRMAGYSPNKNVIVGITNQQPGSITFTYIADQDGFDNDNDGNIDNVDEIATINYSLGGAAGEDLIRRDFTNTSSDNLVIVNNIENLEFVYNTNPDSSVTVGISFLAKTSKAMPNRIFSQTNFTPLSGADWTVTTDLNKGRRFFSTFVHCRNIGL